jgi:hypothetical protein
MSKEPTSLDEWDLLRTIWVLASQDENPLMTYQGIRIRLSLPDDYDVQNMVRRHVDLFREGMPSKILELWKVDMRDGRRLPPWIKQAVGASRDQLINSLGPNDGFRSQKRTGDPAPSSLDVIKWGQALIEEKRKAQSEALEATARTAKDAREETEKKWEKWKPYVIAIISALAGIIAAIIAARWKR